MDLEQLRFPIGRYEKPENFSDAPLSTWINQIEVLPKLLEDETKGLTDHELAFHYRPDGWSIRQVIHHCADSHMNAFIRFKLALTEEQPTIKPYLEQYWAELDDVQHSSIHFSLLILEGVHNRWTNLLKRLTEEQWKRSFIHPQYHTTYALWESAGNYAWHGLHHLAHVKQAKQLQFPH